MIFFEIRLSLIDYGCYCEYDEAWQGWWYSPACSVRKPLCRDGGFVPPAVRMVLLSRSHIDKLFGKDGGLNPACVFWARMVV